jgi:hypothetical protein
MEVCSHAVFPGFCTSEKASSIGRAVSLYASAEKRNLLWELSIMQAGSLHGYRDARGWWESASQMLRKLLHVCK